MMKNNPNDVTSLLTELMQRISDEDLTDEKLAMEIDRGKAVADISTSYALRHTKGDLKPTE